MWTHCAYIGIVITHVECYWFTDLLVKRCQYFNFFKWVIKDIDVELGVLIDEERNIMKSPMIIR